jgi:serine/threonine protein phosphatase PrpC
MKSAKWRYAHASVTGAAHVNQNTVCQDRLLCRVIETDRGEILIAAVADGAGSTSSGQVGAEIACEDFFEQTSKFLRSANGSIESLNQEFGRLWITYLQGKIATLALEEKKPVREFAATLIGAVVAENGAAFYQIGDGAVIYSVSGNPGSYCFGVEPAESEYVNMTNFITDTTAAERLRFMFVEESIEDLVLFSDGIFAVAVDYQTTKPHEPFLMPMIAPLRIGKEIGGLNEKLEKFLASPKINEKTDDDKTIILASRAAIKTSENLA